MQVKPTWPSVCVKTLQGLFIKNFNPSSIKVSTAVVAEMERLTSDILLPPQPVPQVMALTSTEWIKIEHLNVRSYRAKLEDVAEDKCIAHADVMCFTETHLKSHHNVGNLTLNGESSIFYRYDRATSSAQDLSNGGVLIACASSLHPLCTNIQHPPTLEIVSIVVSTKPGHHICVVAVYRRPQLPLDTFLPLLSDYLGNLPQGMPTVILGDFNENLLPSTSSTRLLQLMSSLGYPQLVAEPTTDSGSLIDHVYYKPVLPRFCKCRGYVLLGSRRLLPLSTSAIWVNYSSLNHSSLSYAILCDSSLPPLPT